MEPYIRKKRTIVLSFTISCQKNDFHVLVKIVIKKTFCIEASVQIILSVSLSAVRMLLTVAIFTYENKNLVCKLPGMSVCTIRFGEIYWYIGIVSAAIYGTFFLWRCPIQMDINSIFLFSHASCYICSVLI